ncbi:MAG: restriction endonuclease subunit S [Methanobrevibacter millerae]|uniref:Restriction endonuclease subunit S n=1 Tax=Methanobrevibacter millerae TaxID=230361 RepID=A0A8T3VL23_9EURY|nr:restriction endonuclease subunit S [Methanobrevibacter millerae]MBE6505380.1 restriction endonuclease subunit S [Methanobrevibacter millerae]
MSEEKLVPKLRFIEYSNEWSSYTLGDILTFYSTNSFSREKLNYESGSVKNIHYGDIHTKFPSIVSIENNKEVPFINNDLDLSKFSEDQYLQEGDLIIADASEDYEDIGKAIEVKDINNEKVLAGLHTILARDEKDITVNGFKAYLFSTNNLKTKIKIIANGISVLGISKNNLSKLNVEIPSKNEQQDIVSFISDIDKKIELLERKHQLYIEFKNYLMQQIFTQKLRILCDIQTFVEANLF